MRVIEGRLFDDADASPMTPKPSAQQVYRKEQLAKLPINPEWRPAEIPEIRGEKRIILNCETTGLAWWAADRPVGWAYSLPESGRSGYLPIRHEGGNLPIEQVHRWLQRDVRDLHVENLNTKFDLHMTRADGADLTEQGCTFGDAAHYAALLDDNRFRFNLDQLSKDILGWDVELDGIGKIPSCITGEQEFKHLHASVVAPYAERNVEQVRRLIEAFEPEIIDQDLQQVLRLEQDVLPVVVEMEKNGTMLDRPLLETWYKDVRQRLEDIRWTIRKDTGVALDSFDSAKQLEALFKARGIPVTTFTEHGAPSFTAAVMKEASADPYAALALTGGQLSDLESKYLSKYRKAVRDDGWLRFNLHQLKATRDDGDSIGTVSGRFSAAGDKYGGFNPQQVVAVEKQLERGWCPDFVVRRLFLMNMAADMMQVEYRLFAHYANIAQAFHLPAKRKLINGKWVWVQGPLADFHALVAELLNNPLLNRKLVKNINFAMIYGAGLVKFALMIGHITQKQFDELSARLRARDWSVFKEPVLASASKIRDEYLAMFPAVKPLLEAASERAQNRGYVFDLVGRRARLLGRYHSSLNRIIQGGAASINKRVLVEVYKHRKELELIMRLTVHDELAGNMNPAKLPLLKRILNHQYFDLRAPILWDAKLGNNWAECK